jgi:hypothetical protein
MKTQREVLDLIDVASAMVESRPIAGKRRDDAMKLLRFWKKEIRRAWPPTSEWAAKPVLGVFAVLELDDEDNGDLATLFCQIADAISESAGLD